MGLLMGLGIGVLLGLGMGLIGAWDGAYRGLGWEFYWVFFI